MNKSNTNFWMIGLIIFSVWVLFFKDSDEYSVNVQTNISAADGLDLKAIGPLLKKAKNAQELEKLLNDPTVGVNNLDLNEDDKVDYINVTEYGEGNNRGFSLSVNMGLAEGDTQEVASILLEKKGDQADVQITGNQQIYGRNHYYHSHWNTLGSIFLMSYLFRPHPLYYSPWRYGYYPSHYSSYRRVSYSAYRGRGSVNTPSTMSKSTQKRSTSNIKSPNNGKSSSKVRAPLKSPTRSQKSFQSRNPSKRVRSGGFGRSSRSSVRGRSGSRGGFGRGK